MRFTFFGQDDKILFFRDDAEEAVFATEQYRLTATFPYDPDKVIECGQRVGYTDQDGVFQAFEVRQPKSTLPDNAQSIDCEHIAMAELSDEYNEELLASTTAVNALTGTLSGSLWTVGTTITTGTARKSLSYMTKWAALCAIRDTWDIRFKFRITVGAAGITGRYVDILSSDPVYRGVRLTLDRNVDNIGVTYDDRYCFTAMYGRGKGSSTLAGDDENAAKITFEDVVWATPTNPANKPSGQKWVEDVAAKAAYGRNGRNRFGYHDFSDIDDPAELLQATWDYLQTTNAPRITFDMSVYDLSAYGYSGERLYLGDAVYIIIEPFGIRAEAEVVQLSQDLLHPERTKPVIGNYRADIVYINRDTSAGASKADEMASANPDLLNGIINTMVTAIMSSGTTMYTDTSDGSLVFESADGLKAVRITGGGILLASAKTDGAWVWRTAVTGTGIVADEVTTGTLRATLITILGNDHFYWDSANIYVIDPLNANRQIRMGMFDGVNYGIALTTDGGATWENAITFDGVTATHLSAATGTFAGSLSAATGTFAGTLQAATGTFANLTSLLGYIMVGSLKIEAENLSTETPAMISSEYDVTIASNGMLDFGTRDYSGVIKSPIRVENGIAYVSTDGVDYSRIPQTVAGIEAGGDGNIVLAPSSIGAVPTSTTVNGKALTGNITLSASDVSAVPTSRTVNGKALSSNITLSASDVSAAATSHAHGNITSDGKIGSYADQFVVTGTGGGLTVASPGSARVTMDAQRTIAYGATSPASPFTGQIWLKPKA